MTKTKIGLTRSYCTVCGIESKRHSENPQDHEFKARPRGFAALPRERVQEIARAGAKANHAQGTAHRFTEEEARAAGRKGGLATTQRHGAVGGRRKGRNVAEPFSTETFPTEDKTDVTIQTLPIIDEKLRG